MIHTDESLKSNHLRIFFKYIETHLLVFADGYRVMFLCMCVVYKIYHRQAKFDDMEFFLYVREE